MDSFCGMDCGKCPWKENCKGCVQTNGRPFGGACVLAECCRSGGHARCGECPDASCALKERVMAAF